MKKTLTFFISILCLFFSVQCLADQIEINNNITPYGANKKNIIIEPSISYSSDLNWFKQVSGVLAKSAYIGNDIFYAPLYQWSKSTQYPTVTLKLAFYMADQSGKPVLPSIGSLQFNLQGNLNDKRGVIDPKSIKYVPATGAVYKFTNPPSIQYLQGASFQIDGTIAGSGPVTPSFITNSGWTSGMGNSNDTFVPGLSYWLLDYGTEKGRWTVDTSNNAIGQYDGQLGSANVGSRAYPAIEDQNGQYQAGAGDAYSGVWQIDMKIGSGGSGNVCETFYLAERDNLAPGPQNYMDGSGTAPGGNGREIDIMETKWKPEGPQINLPGANNGTSWNPNMYQSQQMGSWSDLPKGSFITFGAYINKNKLWLYAYKPDGTQWYCTNAIPLDNSSYTQKGPLVPYIGSWGTAPGGNFKTEYKNFIYLPDSSVGNLNPHDNPTAFFKAVESNA